MINFEKNDTNNIVITVDYNPSFDAFPYNCCCCINNYTEYHKKCYVYVSQKLGYYCTNIHVKNNIRLLTIRSLGTQPHNVFWIYINE